MHLQKIMMRFVCEDGVGEGDIVKIDGERMYVLNNQQIHIVDITQDKFSPMRKNRDSNLFLNGI